MYANLLNYNKTFCKINFHIAKLMIAPKSKIGAKMCHFVAFCVIAQGNLFVYHTFVQ